MDWNVSVVTEQSLNWFGGSQCICEGSGWRPALFYLRILLWSLWRPIGSGKQRKSQIHFFCWSCMLICTIHLLSLQGCFLSPKRTKEVKFEICYRQLLARNIWTLTRSCLNCEIKRERERTERTFILDMFLW